MKNKMSSLSVLWLVFSETNLGSLIQKNKKEQFLSRSYGVMAITLDFESNNPSSNLGRTSYFIKK